MTSPLADRVQAHKNWLKRIAAERRAGWMIAVRPRSLDGATAIETRREVIHLEDGVVSRVTALDGLDGAPPPTNALVGMRVVGWATEGGNVYGEYIAGARAILWRREIDGTETSLALTGRVRRFVVVKRAVTGSLTVPMLNSSRSPDSRRGGREASRPRSGVQRSKRTTP